MSKSPIIVRTGKNTMNNIENAVVNMAMIGIDKAIDTLSDLHEATDKEELKEKLYEIISAATYVACMLEDILNPTNPEDEL